MYLLSMNARRLDAMITNIILMAPPQILLARNPRKMASAWSPNPSVLALITKNVPTTLTLIAMRQHHLIVKHIIFLKLLLLVL